MATHVAHVIPGIWWGYKFSLITFSSNAWIDMSKAINGKLQPESETMFVGDGMMHILQTLPKHQKDDHDFTWCYVHDLYDICVCSMCTHLLGIYIYTYICMHNQRRIYNVYIYTCIKYTCTVIHSYMLYMCIYSI